MRAVLLAVMGVALILSGCNKSHGMQSKAAVQSAIEQHLQKQSNVMLNNMSVEVQDVKFDGDRATAAVNFRSKQSPGLVVARQYLLKKAGEQWQVESSASPGGMGGPHGGGMTAQPDSPEGMANPHGGAMPVHPDSRSASPAAPQASH